MTQRELNGRYLSMSAGAAGGLLQDFNISTPPNTFFHTYMVIDDADGNCEKAWLFGTTADKPATG